MGWLLELLFESIREMCSQFIVDMMDIASTMFTEILSCDLDLFEELFGVAGALYQNAVLPIAVMLLLMILTWQLFKSMFGKMGVSSEDPVELVFRSCFCLFMIVYAKKIVNYILEIAGTPYEWVVGTEIEVESFSEYVSVAEAIVSALGVDSLTISLLLLIMQFVVAWNYFKMLFILAERYVLLGIFSYTSPLAFAAGGSKATNHILGSWTKMFGGQVLIVILDAWCVKMFLSAYGNLMASSYGFTKFFAATMCLIGFCKITAKLDSYMGSLGVNLGRIGGGLSGLGAMIMAGRLLNLGGSRGGSGKAGSGYMSFGSGKSISLGNGTGNAMMSGGVSVSGMSAGVGEAADHMNQESAEGAFHAAEGGVQDFDGRERMALFDVSQEGIDQQNLPFGVPDDSDFSMSEEMQADGSGFTSTEGLEDSGESMDIGSSGLFSGEEGPFGVPFDEMAETAPVSEGESGSMFDMGDSGIFSMEDGVSSDSGYSGSISDGGAFAGYEDAGGSLIGGNPSVQENGYAAASEHGTGFSSETVHPESGADRSSYGFAGNAAEPALPAGMYLAERDGERYMRYDADQYEKPQGSFQTIHENGKTYYELPETEKAPAIFAETKAVLEKDGSIRLQKEEHSVPDYALSGQNKNSTSERKQNNRRLPGKLRKRRNKPEEEGRNGK